MQPRQIQRAMRLPFVGPAAFAVVLVLMSQAQGIGREESTESLYSRWTSQFDDKFVTHPDPQEPVFVELLKRPDADLWLLRGLHHTRDPVRWLSRLGLARLKTDRSFRALKQGTKDKNMFVREKCVNTLADFRQPRCVPVLLDVLRTDPHFQPRQRAAYGLVHYPSHEVASALLLTLKNDPPVAIAAAGTLAGLEVSEAIEPTYQLILNTKDYRDREMALWALRGHHHKDAISRLFDYWERQPYPDGPWKEHEIRGIKATLEIYAKQTRDIFSPLPDTLEQWQAWWQEVGPVFPDDMVRPAIAARSPVPIDNLGDDPSKLTFRVALDAEVYRVGDPIAIDLIMQNSSTVPLRTIPPVQSGWRPTMAYGVKLERLGATSEVLIDHKPSSFYVGSYSGPPEFQTLRPGATFKNRQCMHDWLGWLGALFRQNWPLTEGNYQLTITFDNAEFAGVRAHRGEVLHRWQASPVKFAIRGKPRRDPAELLQLLGQKTGMRWLKDDLTSQRSERRDAAWFAIHLWGDSRLEPYLSRLPVYEKYRDRWGSLVPPFGSK